MSQPLDIRPARLGQWRWDVLAAWHPWLTAHAALPWQDLSRTAGAARLKSNPGRDVWRLDGERPVVAKIYHSAGVWSRLKQRVRGADAALEFSASCHAASRNLPVIRPVGYGRSGSTHVFVSEWVASSCPLDEAWLAADRETQRDLAAAVGRWLRRLHDGALLAVDVHPGNILVHVSNGTVTLTLVDLHGARLVYRRGARLGAFVDLHQWFGRHACRTDQLRCLAAYLPEDEPLRPHAQKILTLSRRRAEQLARSRDRRIFGDGRHVSAITRPQGWGGWVVLRPRHNRSSATYGLDAWHAALDQLGPLGDRTATATLSLGRQATTVRVEHGRLPGMRSRWIAQHRAANRNQPGPQPLALLCHGRDRAVLIYVD